MWQKELKALANGPYKLYGGKKILAEALEIKPRFLRQLLKRRQQPGYKLGKRITALYEAEVQVDAPL